MKKIEPVRNYVVFAISKNAEQKSTTEIKKELENIMRKQIINCA